MKFGNLIPKRIVDKNGKQTTVRVRPDVSSVGKQRKLNPAPPNLYPGKEEKQQRLLEDIRSDIERNTKPKLNKDGTMTVSVFRSGVPNPPEQRGVEAEVYEISDGYRPGGRTGRYKAVFASPLFGGVHRWVHGNSFNRGSDIKVRELRVNADKVYVYKIIDWERASSSFNSLDGTSYDHETSEHVDNSVLHRRYWDNGMTLREWIEKAPNDPSFNPGDWEVLLDESEIEMVKPVSGQRVVDNVYDEYEFLRTEVARHLGVKNPS